MAENLGQTPNDRNAEICCTYVTLSKRARYHRNLLFMFTKLWKWGYLTGLMETFKSKQILNDISILPGDVVLLINEQIKGCF